MLSNLFTPHESNELLLYSGSDGFNLEQPELILPYKSNVLDISGSVYNWEMEKVSTHDMYLDSAQWDYWHAMKFDDIAIRLHRSLDLPTNTYQQNTIKKH